MNAQLQRAGAKRRNRKNRQDRRQCAARPTNDAPFTPITAAAVLRQTCSGVAEQPVDAGFTPAAFEKAAGAVQVTSDSTLASMLAYAAKAVRERDAMLGELRRALCEGSHPMEHMVAREWHRRMTVAGVPMQVTA